MSESFDQNANESSGLVHEYMERAARARSLGDSRLGLHLFLAAYGEAAKSDAMPTGEGLSALKEAWALALELKERSLAEYIFEKMEPALSAAESKACSERLQGLTLDKLEEYGISRKDLEEVSDYIVQELSDGDGFPFSSDGFGALPLFNGISGSPAPKTFTLRASIPAPGKPSDKTDAPASDAKPDDSSAAGADDDARGGSARAIAPSAGASPVPAKPSSKGRDVPAEAAPQPSGAIEFFPGAMRYTDLAGYANAIRAAKALGIGRERDPRYTQLVQELNARHGLVEPPAFDPILITAPVREDASRFVLATAGEIGLPSFRMYVEDNPQGLAALCVSGQQTNSFTFNRKTGTFEGRGVLVLEDIDLWDIPTLPEDSAEAMPPFIAMQISRGVRELYNFIRAAVDSPNVTVLVTAESEASLTPFFLDLLYPYETVEIQFPTAGERASIWNELVHDHPSLRGMNVAMLVKNSANMARYDIYTAVADALDESYREDLLDGRFHPVRATRLFEKLAAFQPLDSEEYRTLEEAVVSDFRTDLAHIDDILDL